MTEPERVLNWRGPPEPLAAESALHRLDPALLALTLEHISTRVAVINREYRYTYLNREALKFMGLPAGQVVGKHMSEVLDAALYQSFVPLLERVFGGETLHIEGWVDYQRQGRRFREQTLFPFTAADGSIPAVIVCGLDHTEQRLNEQLWQTSEALKSEQIARQRDALRQSEKLSAMGSLLAGVAHELNNPLAIVMGRASLLEERLQDRGADAQTCADLQRIREAAERCGRIVRTFLNMARSRPTQRSTVHLHELVQAAADMLAYSYRSHGINLDLALAPDLPSLQADGDQLGQVVLNLMVNAQQALTAHEGERRVRVSTGLRPAVDEETPAQLWLRIADTGPGIAAAARAKLFEPFFTTKAEGNGTGLGLSLSRSLAREHGGELALEPADLAGGASFVLTLPLPPRQ
nr:ATP-binding protein [uncultured Roseateles sp.]